MLLYCSPHEGESILIYLDATSITGSRIVVPRRYIPVQYNVVDAVIPVRG